VSPIEWGLSPCFAGEKEDLQARQALIQQAMFKADQEFQTQMAMREKAITDLAAAQAKMDQLKSDFTMLQGKLKEIADKLNAMNKPPEPEKK
jgi:uncharacterized protein YpuA (DUF1002 family)